MVQFFSEELLLHSNFIQVKNKVYSFDFSGFDQPRHETRVTTLVANFVKQAVECAEVCRLDWKSPIIGCALACYKNSKIYFTGGNYLQHGSPVQVKIVETGKYGGPISDVFVYNIRKKTVAQLESMTQVRS